MIVRRGYALAFVLILAVELAIARFAHDRFVRPFVGDVLAVIGVFCGLRALLRASWPAAAIAAVALGFVIEGLQALALPARLGIAPGNAVGVVLGSTFDPLDLLAYAVGGGVIVAVELSARRRAPARPQASPPR